MSDKVVLQAHPAKATIKDTWTVLADVVFPTLAKGVLIPRPKVERFAERTGLDGRAVKRLQQLRRTYGPGPLLLSMPFRPQAVVLSAEHVHQILGDTDTFAPATREKRAALAHFEPNVSLASRPPERAELRRFNDEILESTARTHSMVGPLSAIISDEANELLAKTGGELGWESFIAAWYRAVRRLIPGRDARDDHELTRMLADLRYAANWAFLHPVRKRLRSRFHDACARIWRAQSRTALRHGLPLGPTQI